MRISERMKKAIIGGSMVRAMFEEGVKLKKIHGPDKVFDYSLGNPDLPPPARFNQVVQKIIEVNAPGIHGYMNNAGWPDAREKLAAYLDKILGPGLKAPIGPEQVLMTVGAAGAMNVALKAVVDLGSSVVVLAPYFMEYNYYISNHGGEVAVAQTNSSFRPDVDAVKAQITDKTVAIIINSPNNPTGAIYTAEELAELGRALAEESERRKRPILLLADEPYRKLAYNDTPVPSVFKAYPYSVVVSSFSKDLSLAGERIGYAAINPEMTEGSELMEAMVLANRILGFVNAPSMAQKAAIELLEESVDLATYRRRQDLLATELTKIGYELVRPEGTFYLFPKSPIADDLAFIEILREKLILAVPGAGFGRPGHFRLSLCLKEEMIRASLAGFAEAISHAARNK